MDSYNQSAIFYTASPNSHSSFYSNYSSPSTSYCYCCCTSTHAYPSHHSTMSPSFNYSPISYMPPPPQQQQQMNYFDVTPSPPATREPTPPKITRRQYSTRDRYILNELFKRTPYPNGIQRDVIARRLGISSDQIRIWFQNRRRLQTQRDAGERMATSSELNALQRGKNSVQANDLRQLIHDVAQYKDAPPRLRLDESS